MRFEFDPAKSDANKVKHGIDFVEAQGIWNDANRLENSRAVDERAALPGDWPNSADYVCCLCDVPP